MQRDSKNIKDAVAALSTKDFEQLEAMKVEYLKHYFKAAKQSLKNGTTVDGNSFLNSL
jgi:hypothetical protein